MSKSNIKDICKRIRREYPHIKVISESYLWTSDSCISECGDDECSPALEMSLEDLFNKLESIGIYVTGEKSI